jgi:Glycosyltransferase like family
MISIIVCSRSALRFNEFAREIDSTIGVPYQMIRIDNSGSRYGLCEAYNAGKLQAIHPIVCFIHEDLFFHTESWGKILARVLIDNTIGLVGLMGICYLGLFPDVLVDPRECEGQILQGDKPGWPRITAARFGVADISDVVAIDGCFMAGRKEVIDQFNFSDDLLKHFHGYDCDYSLQVYQQYRIVVSRNLWARHMSSGNFDEHYFSAYRQLRQKWKKHLPVYLSKYSKRDIQGIQLRAVQKYLYENHNLHGLTTVLGYAISNGIFFQTIKSFVNSIIR